MGTPFTCALDHHPLQLRRTLMKSAQTAIGTRTLNFLVDALLSFPVRARGESFAMSWRTKIDTCIKFMCFYDTFKNG